MPIRNETTVCVNHPEQEMMTHTGFNALVRVSVKKGSAIILDPHRGMPCAVLMCPLCGYIELYNAMKHETWENTPEYWDIEPKCSKLRSTRDDF